LVVFRAQRSAVSTHPHLWRSRNATSWRAGMWWSRDAGVGMRIRPSRSADVDVVMQVALCLATGSHVSECLFQ